ncbi:MAG: peroxiredoxin, partial [Bdellovibrionales bacterium]|nr:peroxiredoxin [Bdellovibrionales bacterium]NQZ18638.1 peroxiredoxin [Bdellovibrionales bacterium]
MKGLGEKFPEFNLKAVVSNDMETAFQDVSNETYDGKWLVVFFYPKDFTFVCPTEIKGFADLNSEFESRNAQILAGSIDSEFVHLAWRNDHGDLRDLPFPMLSDIKRELSKDLGILDEEEGVSQRAT